MEDEIEFLIGGVILLILLIFISIGAILYCRRKKRRQNHVYQSKFYSNNFKN